MLSELRIRDFAIIDELDITFGSGFSVLTGETGAGKSIIIDAVGLLLGGRADATVVRTGGERSLVEGVFRLEPDRQERLAPLLAREGLEGDDPDVLLIGREVRLGGRNVCRINGRAVTLGLLRESARGLVDIHGQSEHLNLLRSSEQLRLLDRYAGTESRRCEVARLARSIRDVRGELADLVEHDQELAQRADLLEFQVREIGAAGLVVGEEEDLLAERTRLANAEELATLTASALRSLAQGDEQAPSALDLVGAAVQSLEKLARVDAALAPLLEAGAAVSFKAEELAEGLRDYRERIEVNPVRLRAVEDRLLLVRQLERKYGPTIGDVHDYAGRAAAELERISNSDERVAELRQEEAVLLAGLGQQASELSRERMAAASHLAQCVEAELGELRMDGSRFAVRFSWRPDPAGVVRAGGAPAAGLNVDGDFDAHRAGPASEADAGRVAFGSGGIDTIAFLVSPNPGEPPKPVAKVASGGETSRLMLALKSVLSQADETPTLIFDEIDQGIGGRVGATVGEKLWGLTVPAVGDGSARQVLCVTHLPQLAGFGDVHLRVAKESVAGRTVTRVRELDSAQRALETAQMLGTVGAVGERSARTILRDIASRKREVVGSAAASPEGAD